VGRSGPFSLLVTRYCHGRGELISKRLILVVEVLLGILIVGSALTVLASPNNPGVIVSVLILVVIFFSVLRRLSKMP